MTSIGNMTIGFVSIALSIFGYYYSLKRDIKGFVYIKGLVPVSKRDDPVRFRRIMRWEYGVSWMLFLFGTMWLILIAIR